MKKREMVLVSALARTGSVTLSATAAGMSQPAASAMLAQLEDRLGVALFTRNRRRLELTAECRALMPEISHALIALESVERAAESMGRGKRRRIVIGAVPAASTGVLPQAVKSLLQKRPDTAIVVKAGTANEVVEMAVQERIDLGLIYGSTLHEHVAYKNLGPLALMCVMPHGHPYAESPEVTVAQLIAAPYISHSRYLPVGALTAQAIEAAGGEFSPCVEVMQFSAACAMVEAGCGVAVLESLAARYAEGHGLVARPLIAESGLALRAVWSSTKGLNATSLELLGYLESLMSAQPAYSGATEH